MPIWTYGKELWGSTSKTHIKPINRLHSKTIRKLTNAEWLTSNDSIFKQFNKETIVDHIVKNCDRNITRILTHENENKK